MSKRVEERALEAYPEDISYSTVLERPFDYNGHQRMIFQQGYEQAEKDLELTWEDIRRISRILDIMVDDDFKGEIPEEWGEEEYYEEVLRRFNKAMEEKK